MPQSVIERLCQTPHASPAPSQATSTRTVTPQPAEPIPLPEPQATSSWLNLDQLHTLFGAACSLLANAVNTRVSFSNVYDGWHRTQLFVHAAPSNAPQINDVLMMTIRAIHVAWCAQGWDQHFGPLSLSSVSHKDLDNTERVFIFESNLSLEMTLVVETPSIVEPSQRPEASGSDSRASVPRLREYNGLVMDAERPHPSHFIDGLWRLAAGIFPRDRDHLHHAQDALRFQHRLSPENFITYVIDAMARHPLSGMTDGRPATDSTLALGWSAALLNLAAQSTRSDAQLSQQAHRRLDQMIRSSLMDCKDLKAIHHGGILLDGLKMPFEATALLLWPMLVASPITEASNHHGASQTKFVSEFTSLCRHSVRIHLGHAADKDHFVILRRPPLDVIAAHLNALASPVHLSRHDTPGVALSKLLGIECGLNFTPPDAFNDSIFLQRVALGLNGLRTSLRRAGLMGAHASKRVARAETFILRHLEANLQRQSEMRQAGPSSHHAPSALPAPVRAQTQPSPSDTAPAPQTVSSGNSTIVTTRVSTWLKDVPSPSTGSTRTSADADDAVVSKASSDKSPTTTTTLTPKALVPLSQSPALRQNAPAAAPIRFGSVEEAAFVQLPARPKTPDTQRPSPFVSRPSTPASSPRLTPPPAMLPSRTDVDASPPGSSNLSFKTASQWPLPPKRSESPKVEAPPLTLAEEIASAGGIYETIAAWFAAKSPEGVVKENLYELLYSEAFNSDFATRLISHRRLFSWLCSADELNDPMLFIFCHAKSRPNYAVDVWLNRRSHALLDLENAAKALPYSDPAKIQVLKRLFSSAVSEKNLAFAPVVQTMIGNKATQKQRHAFDEAQRMDLACNLMRHVCNAPEAYQTELFAKLGGQTCVRLEELLALAPQTAPSRKSLAKLGTHLDSLCALVDTESKDILRTGVTSASSSLDRASLLVKNTLASMARRNAKPALDKWMYAGRLCALLLNGQDNLSPLLGIRFFRGLIDQATALQNKDEQSSHVANAVSMVLWALTDVSSAQRIQEVFSLRPTGEVDASVKILTQGFDSLLRTLLSGSLPSIGARFGVDVGPPIEGALQTQLAGLAGVLSLLFESANGDEQKVLRSFFGNKSDQITVKNALALQARSVDEAQNLWRKEGSLQLDDEAQQILWIQYQAQKQPLKRRVKALTVWLKEAMLWAQKLIVSGDESTIRSDSTQAGDGPEPKAEETAILNAYLELAAFHARLSSGKQAYEQALTLGSEWISSTQETQRHVLQYTLAMCRQLYMNSGSGTLPNKDPRGLLLSLMNPMTYDIRLLLTAEMARVGPILYGAKASEANATAPARSGLSVK